MMRQVYDDILSLEDDVFVSAKQNQTKKECNNIHNENRTKQFSK